MHKCLKVLCFAVATVVAFDLDSNAQDIISGKFYRYQIVGRPGLGDVSSVLSTGPSINKFGQVAFTGIFGSGRAVFVTDIGSNPPRRIATGAANAFLGGVQINNSQQLVAVDKFPTQEPNGFYKMYLRRYEAAPPGPYTNILVAGANDLAAANDFQELRFEAAVSDTGQPTYSGTRYLPSPPGGATNALATGIRPTINKLDLPLGLRPMIGDDGRVVVRAGGSSSSPIKLYANNLATSIDVADATKGFTALGQSPGISPDGSVIVFYGLLNSSGATALGTNPGAGIFASLDVGAPTRRIVRLVGRRVEDDQSAQGLANGNNDGVCDPGEACIPGELGVLRARHRSTSPASLACGRCEST